MSNDGTNNVQLRTNSMWHRIYFVHTTLDFRWLRTFIKRKSNFDVENTTEKHALWKRKRRPKKAHRIRIHGWDSTHSPQAMNCWCLECSFVSSHGHEHVCKTKKNTLFFFQMLVPRLNMQSRCGTMSYSNDQSKYFIYSLLMSWVNYQRIRQTDEENICILFSFRWWWTNWKVKYRQDEVSDIFFPRTDYDVILSI